jgi:hypothetical protein
MVRWIRIAAIGLLGLSMIGVGIGVGLLLVANNRWVAVEVPAWLEAVFRARSLDLWLPALLAGWFAAALALAALLLWSLFYVWRRKQYEAIIARLERELATLRNLPFTRPAPLEDLPERRDWESVRLAAAAAELDAALAADAGDEAEV